MSSDSSTAGEPGVPDAAQVDEVLPVDGTAADDVRPADSPQDAQDGKGNAEAARWRREARANETELIVERSRLSELNRKHAEQLFSRHLSDPADAWYDTKLEDVLGSDGLVDEDAVADVAGRIIEKHPAWKATLRPVGAPAAAMTADDPISASKPVGWVDLLRGDAG